MALKPAGSAQQKISWRTAPTFSAKTGDVGVPGGSTGGWTLRSVINNPQGKTITYALVPGYSYPAGWSGNSAGAINWNGSATPVDRTPLKWRATQQNPSYFVDSPEGWVEALSPAVATPRPPINLTATALSSTAIELTWEADLSGGASTPTKYHIFRTATGVPPWGSAIATVNAPGLTYTNTDLDQGETWHYCVQAEDANGALSTQSVAKSATTSVPSVPLIGNIVTLGQNSLQVNWTAGAGGSVITGYKVWWSATETGTYAAYAPVENSPYVDSADLSPGETRWYKVSAVDISAEESLQSPAHYGTTEVITVTYPATPIYVSAEPTSSTAIMVTWQPGEGGGDVTEFHVYRSTTPGGPYGAPVDTVSAAAQLASDTFNRADSNDLGAAWDAGITANSNFNIVSNTAKKTVDPATDGWETNNTVAWPADQYSQFTIAAVGAVYTTYPSGIGATVRMSAAVPPLKTMYRLVVCGAGWQVRKTVYNTSSVALASGTTPTFTAGDVVRLSVAGSATAVLRCSKNGVEFATVNDSTSPHTTGKPGIFYQSNDPTAAIQSWSGGGNFQHESTGLAETTPYYFVVRAFDGVNESEASVEDSATTHTVSPTMPTIISVVPLASAPQTTLRVTWVAGGGGSTPTYYHLYRSDTQAGTYTQVAGSGNIAATSYNNSGLQVDADYWYKVRAFDAQDDQSGQSPAVSGHTASALAPTMPENVVANGTSPSVIRVTWTPGAGGSVITQYRIHRGLTSSGTFDQIGTDAASPYDDTGLPSNTSYFYRVSAYDGTTESAQSPPDQGATLSSALPTTPVSVTAQATSSTAVRVAWIPGPGGSTITGFNVYRSASSGSGYSKITATPDSASPYDNTGLTANMTYYYKVSSVDTSGAESAQSAFVHATTTLCQIGFYTRGVTVPTLPSSAATADTTKGLFFDSTDLARWTTRAASGPYKNANDVRTGTPGDWTRILSRANSFRTNSEPLLNLSLSWTGGTSPLFNAGTNMVNAAFAYRVTGDVTYRNAVRDWLLTQVAHPSNDLTTLCYRRADGGNNQDGFLPNGYASARLALGYDYIKHGLTAGERLTIEQFLLRTAYLHCDHLHWGIQGIFPNRRTNDYATRGGPASSGALWSEGAYSMIRQSPPYSNCSATGSYPHYAYVDSSGVPRNRTAQYSLYWNNRKVAEAAAFGLIGVLLNDAFLISEAKRWITEHLLYSTYPGGTQGEYERNGDYCNIQMGAVYGASNTGAFMFIAEALRRTGDNSLFAYTTTDGLHGTQSAAAPKSLLALVDAHLGMLDNTLLRYFHEADLGVQQPRAASKLSTLKFYTGTWLYHDLPWLVAGSTLGTTRKDRIQRKASAGFATFPGGDGATVDAGFDTWAGLYGILPGVLFMYGD